MSEWKPIETAPRDGTEFLAFAPPHKMAVCWMENISTAKPLWLCRVPEWNFDYYDHPEFTLWQPLPAPPVSSKNRGTEA